MALLIRANGTVETIEPKNGTDFKFKDELYSLIAPETNMIEVVYLADGRLMLLDEEGKLQDEEFHVVNPEATRLLALAGGIPGDYVVGDVVVCDSSQLQ